MATARQVQVAGSEVTELTILIVVVMKSPRLLRNYSVCPVESQPLCLGNALLSFSESEN
jgi:hypothetical protein